MPRKKNQLPREMGPDVKWDQRGALRGASKTLYSLLPVLFLKDNTCSSPITNGTVARGARGTQVPVGRQRDTRRRCIGPDDPRTPLHRFVPNRKLRERTIGVKDVITSFVGHSMLNLLTCAPKELGAIK